ncbi:hypothetical protein [Pulveribacter suum]|uniref:General secretion pathway protein GspN n=1 Tax=Pulveribacter suum TaxID=2116657 RepID=A0A2P1NPB8_9BURK|nr:hypothetical protein [Pulveribacter suum]AVP58853.1 hypothetical protein C7H73_15035 [Pulveribacter suum]
MTGKKYALHALVLVNACLALALAYLWLSPDEQQNNLRWRAPEPQLVDYAAMLPALPGPAQIDTGQFIAMLERPVFSLTRRPPPPPPPPAAEEQVATDTLGTAQLSGIFQGAGNEAIIIQIAGKPRRVRLDETVDGWRLSSVQARSATFARGSQTRELQLPRAALTKGAANNPAVPAPQPPPARGQDEASPSSPPSPAPSAPKARPRPSFGGGTR